MDNDQFQDLLSSLSGLSIDQRRLLVEATEKASSTDKALDIANDRAERCKLCPDCQSTRIWRWGFKDGVQRFRCKDCGRTFNALTGTPLARLKRLDAWLAYCDALIAGLSVRKAALVVGVHKNTAFRWRHRMLTAPNRVKDVEMDP